MAQEKQVRHQLLKVFTQYGLHIWAILVIANAVLVYAYQFSTQAAVKVKVPKQQADIAANAPPAVSGSPEVSQEPAAPGGPVINLSFSVPGIGSGGGTMKPLHTKRNVTVFLYQTSVNSRDPKVKPLFTIKGTALYDTDPNSATYTSFINPALDLGSTVTDGDYQMVFRTDQSMRSIVKENLTDVGGKTFSLSKGQQALLIPHQNMLMGDTIPDEGDYEIDATDYNAFINCYGEKNKTTFCTGKNFGDFDDNGVIDGVDYNILLRSLAVLQQEGFSVPQVAGPKQTSGRVAPLKKTATPTPAPKKKATPTSAPSVAPVQKTSGGGGALGVILVLFFFLILGGVGFFLYKTNENIRNKIRSLIHLSPTGTPSTETDDPAATEEQTQTDPNAPVEADVALASDTATTTPTPATEVPAEQALEEGTPTPIAQTPPPATTTPPAADGTIEKECYVKKKGPDEAGTGEWLLLTDDNGPVEGHYAKAGAVDGFAKVKGVMKTENGKTFLEISELTAE